MTMYYLPFVSKYGRPGRGTMDGGTVDSTLCQGLPFRVPRIRRPTFPTCRMGVRGFKTGKSKLFLGAGTVGSTVGSIGRHNKKGIVVPRNV